MYKYPSFAASWRASVLLPQDDHPSMVMMIFLSALGNITGCKNEQKTGPCKQKAILRDGFRHLS
jgi:hypothetical protein